MTLPDQDDETDVKIVRGEPDYVLLVMLLCKFSIIVLRFMEEKRMIN